MGQVPKPKRTKSQKSVSLTKAESRVDNLIDQKLLHGISNDEEAELVLLRSRQREALRHPSPTPADRILTDRQLVEDAMRELGAATQSLRKA